jgi:glycosyltransferase involved in cell wall biosynthesis
MRSPLLICSKSEWRPSVRREHAWAAIAAQAGHPVTFVERPCDIRQLGGAGRRAWARGLIGSSAREDVIRGIRVRPRSTLLPGHRSALAAHTNAALLRRTLALEAGSDCSIVFSWPWDWPAVRKADARRRVFDMADDWGELMPGRSPRFRRYYDEIAAEADEIIIVNPDLARHFPDRRPVVVRNGVSEAMLGAPVTAPEPRTMVYVGTLTHRFNSALMRGVLEELTDWRLVIIGACSYPKLGDRPDPELLDLLSLGERVRWHGPLERSAALPWLDRATVAVVPNRPEFSLGQDSMKFYDYAARGRPIVSTNWFDAERLDHPPVLLTADTPSSFAAAVLEAAAQPSSAVADRRAWAGRNTWASRWPAWSAAAFGRDGSAALGAGAPRNDNRSTVDQPS